MAKKKEVKPNLDELMMEIKDNMDLLHDEFEKAGKVASSAARARKLTSTLTHQFKQFRADSVEYFKK